MPASPINTYLARLRQDFRSGSATERTYYATLQALVEAIQPGIKAPFEQKRIECGAIDFHVKRGDLTIGYIEAKDVGASLDEAEQTEQLKKRYIPNLPNLILTNYLEFRWYRNGTRQNRTAILGHVDTPGGIGSTRQAQDDLRSLLSDFLAVTPQGATNAKDLAIRLAHFAHEIRIVIGAALAQGKASHLITDLRDAVHKQLIPDLTDGQFADMFAQTLVYGFFAARCNHPVGQPFVRANAAREIPRTNPFLRKLFESITGTDLDEEPFVGYVDDAIQLLDHTDMAAVLAEFGQRTGREDPVVHFYETFLKAYDPKLRELRGVYYTPEPVVSYMVRSVDHLLRTRFNCSGGFADAAQITYERATEKGEKETATAPRVLVLDPALGTGTFLYAIIDLIRQRFRRENNAGMWSTFVRDQLLPRLFGFELLMAPYAVAHLKLGLQLAGQDLSDEERKTWAYDFSGDERLGIYLTNTLDEAAHKSETLFGPYRAITEEANAAADIKRDKPIMVVIGNPPYSSDSANRGKWITTLMEGYKHTVRQAEIQIQALSDDYVKFIRFAQWRIERSGQGIVAMITNNGYLDGVLFRDMRRSLMETFAEVWVLNLHGSSRKLERSPDGTKDENVFDIKQGVSIIILSLPPGSRPQASSVHYAELWGGREAKYQRLREEVCRTIHWQSLDPRPPHYLFVPSDSDLQVEYEGSPALIEIFGTGDYGKDAHLRYAAGFATQQDQFAIAHEREGIEERVSLLLRSSEAEVRSRYRLCTTTQWDFGKAKAWLASHRWRAMITRVLYRPFDYRWTVFSWAVVSIPRLRVMRHLLPPAQNLALITSRIINVESFAHCFVARVPTEKITLSARTSNNAFAFPLYLYDLPTEDESSGEVAPVILAPRISNLNPAILTRLARSLSLRFLPDGQGDLLETFGPEDVFAYIYAILHCPTYRTRYAEFLKRDFPRIPFTSNREFFAGLVAKGRELIALHVMESPLLDALITSFPEPGPDKVERVAYDDSQRRVYINKTQYFDGVPGEVWGFHVGGYQVCDKWLKERKGRQLSNNDLMHYQRIIAALNETIRLMAEIDALIPAWPIA
jgi:predicted helicase